ncbi:MAG TPA: hypothetical protein VH370_08925 [Humisphaera sp.]|jgi:hypothetical protein|nr:hypothetical protein [Humisphaera sp.]
MSIASLKRWHWIAISLAIGLLVGSIRQQAAADLQDRFGESINGQQHFEQMLTSTVEGQPAFQQITVHAQSVPDGKGGTKPAYIVAGAAFNGHAEEHNGKSEARLYPSFFIAPAPYHPKFDLSKLNHPGGTDFAREYQSIPNPTVLDFLKVLSEARGLSYTHAWWLGMGLAQWTIASFILIGIVWPTIVNLLVFGSLRRPAEEKGIDLSKVVAHPQTPAKVPASAEDEARLRELELELEKQLAGAQVGIPTPHEMAKPPVRPLNAVAAQAAEASLGPESHVEFGTKKDDYYPTEVHAAKSQKS